MAFEFGRRNTSRTRNSVYRQLNGELSGFLAVGFSVENIPFIHVMSYGIQKRHNLFPCYVVDSMR